MTDKLDQNRTIKTVGDLKRDLALYLDHMELYIEGFIYYRTKMRGENILQMELNEKEDDDE